MPPPHQVSAGKISYRLDFVANTAYHGGIANIFSDELRAFIRRRNVPERRIVWFDGRHARTEEINTDYGVGGRSFELRVAASDTITYCKDSPYFGFCVEHPNLLPPGGPPPD